MSRILVTPLALLLGLFALANGVSMSVSPEPWYWAVAGVPDRGPFNQHFIRDIGFIYLLIGTSLLYGTVYSKHRFYIWMMPALWLVLHAIFHIWEVLVGICGPESLLEDFIGVTLPGLVSLWLLYFSYQRPERA